MIDSSRPFELIRKIGHLGVCIEQDDCLDELNETIEQLMRERDAAVADMSTLTIGNRFTNSCDICKHKFGEDPCPCLECDEVRPNGNFEWRGIAG